MQEAVARRKRRPPYQRSMPWRPHGIAQGYAGLALLWGYLDRCSPDEGWDHVARKHIELAVGATERLTRIDLGLYSGISGLALSAVYLSRDGVRYRRLVAKLESVLLPETRNLATSLLTRTTGLAVFEFDVISGLAGIGRYLLLRRDSPEAAATLQLVLKALIHLAGDEDGLPRWHTPAQLMREDNLAKLYPQGNLNCGLAHGCPGPLALLSLAAISGEKVEGLSEAIHRLARWLASNRFDDQWGMNWPTSIPLTARLTPIPLGGAESAANPDLAPYRASRSAWCYGSPGVARALWLAGKGTGSAEYQDLAIEAMAAVYRRPEEARRIDSPTFCHGVAGLLQITLCFARDTSLPMFREATGILTDQLLRQYEPRSRVGFRNIEPSGNLLELPGLLEGAAGVALVLLAASTRVEPSWDALFLLS